MAMPTDKKLVSFNANIEAWEAFKAKAYENGTDASTLLNQMLQAYIDAPQSETESELAILADKLCARFDALEEKITKRIDKAGNHSPDLLAIRDRVIREWEGPGRIRITQFGKVLNVFIREIEAAGFCRPEKKRPSDRAPKTAE